MNRIIIPPRKARMRMYEYHAVPSHENRIGLIRRVKMMSSTDIIMGWVDDENLIEVISAAIVSMVFMSEISLYRTSVLGTLGLISDDSFYLRFTRSMFFLNY